MADTKLGGVYYEVDARTDGLLQLQSAVDKATGNIAKEFKQADTAVAQSTSRMKTSMTGTAKAVGQATNAFRLQKGSAQQLGFQLQDVAVQAQMGTSWFTILGQQGSQLAAVMGPGGALFGAVIAISAAIGGVLVKAMQNAGEAGKKLPEELQKRLDEIKEKLQEVDEESKQAFTQVELGRLNTEYNALQARIENLQAANEGLQTAVKNANDPRTITQANQALSANESAIKNLKSEQSELALLQERITQEVLLSKDGWTQYEDEASKSVDTTQQIAQQIQVATEKIVNGESAARRMALAFQLGLTSAEMLPAELQKALDVLEASEAAAEDESAWRKQLLEDQKQAIADMDAERKAAHDAELKRIRAEEAERKRLESSFGSAVSSAASEVETPAQRAQRELEERLSIIKQYHQLETEEQARQTNAGILAEQAYQQRLTEIKKAEEEKRLSMNSTTLGATAELFGNLAKMAEQGGKDSFNAWKVFASAQAAVNAALAITNVLATVPPPLSFALAGSVAAITGAQIANIASTSYGGGRLYGGPVSAGTMYPITENGKPEILQQGNRQYLLPGTGGNVISNKDMMSAGGSGVNVTVNVNNSSSANVDVQRRQGADRSEIIDIVVADIQGRGRVQRAITSTTTASNKI